MKLDLLFKNVLICDGTGKKAREGSVGVCGDTIVLPENRQDLPASYRTIDAGGMAISPGSINIHGHSDTSLLIDGRVPSVVHQGITTEVIGNCGLSLAPLYGEALRETRQDLKKYYNLDVTWGSFEELLREMDRRKTAINVISLVGHGTLRGSVVGMGDRKPDPDELEKMYKLFLESLEGGAFGLSTGLIYPPGSFAETDEIIFLAKGCREKGGYYATHIRGEGDSLIDAIKEAIEIGVKAGVRLEISHLKACGKNNWGKTAEALQIIRNARKRGLFVQHDQYPYTASSTGLSMMIPQWAQDGGNDEFIRRLKDPSTRKKIKKEMEGDEYSTGETVIISWVHLPKNKKYEGKQVNQLAQKAGKPVTDFIIDLLIEEEGSVGAIYKGMCEEDVVRVMKDKYTSVGTDGQASSTEGPLNTGKPHPRTYGAFPRVLGRYCRDKKLFSLEEAVRKMTSLPAGMIGLKDRGIIADGKKADLVVFDPLKIRDTSTISNPHSYPEGIEYAVVNGKITLEKGKIVKSDSGKILRSTRRFLEV